jgi:oxalate decarboxylase
MTVTRRDFAAAAGLGLVGALLPGERGMTLADRIMAEPAEPIPPFTFKIEQQVGKVAAGGVGKEATVKEFALSEGLAGVSMYLKPGGLRELHWHALAAEWAFMDRGRCRITVFDPDGHNEVVDLGPGDIWYFPRGYGHSLQGLGPEETHFVLIFDSGHFSEYGTFSITDWMGLTGQNVLSQNFSTPASTFANIPKKEVYIAQGRVPAALPTDPPPGTERVGAETHRYRLMAQAPHEFPGGTIRIASSVEFPVSRTMTGAYMTLKPGALRAMHWHPNADEWQYYIQGKGRMTLFIAGSDARTMDFQEGDVGYVPISNPHYIENTGDTDLVFLEMFKSREYQDISLGEWMAHTPHLLMDQHLKVGMSMLDAIPKQESVITPV